MRRVKEFTRATTMKAYGVNVFKIMTFGLVREQRNLTLKNRVQYKILGRDEIKTCTFCENPPKRESGL